MVRTSTNILILGGTGFLGSSFAAHAAAWGYSTTRASRTGGAGVLAVDATSVAQVREAIEATQAGTIVFAASRLTPRSRAPAPSDAMVEPAGALSTLEAAAQAGVQHLVYFSSGGAVYGGGDVPHREADRCSPRSLYGSLKCQTEDLISTLAPAFGIRHTNLRIANPYGPGQSPLGAHGVIAKFLHLMLNRKPVTILGSAKAAKDYVYVEDLNRAVLAAIESQVVGTFNIGSGQAVSLMTLLDLMERVCGMRAECVREPLPDQEVSSFALDIDKARLELGWVPTTSLSEGIKRMHMWLTHQDNSVETSAT